MTTVQTLNDSDKMNDRTISAKPFGYRFSKIKREATPPISQPKVVSHFILPHRTTTGSRK